MKIQSEEPEGLTPLALASPPPARGPLSPRAAPRVADGARRRGRPVEMPPETVLERIRSLAVRREGLFRVHHTHPSLYARARRLFGSWEGAVRACGFDYAEIVGRAFARAAQARRRSRRRAFVTLP